MRAQATALACSLPQEKGRALSRWSLAEIAAQLVTLQVVVGVARSTLWRWFRADQLKPWRYHNWQHVLDPQAFLERARPVLRLYEQAKALLLEGIWVLCLDEKTSIQARELEQPSRPARGKYPVHNSPRYKRHGALQLFAGLSVADGQKYAKTAERKRFAAFALHPRRDARARSGGDQGPVHSRRRPLPVRRRDVRRTARRDAQGTRR